MEEFVDREEEYSSQDNSPGKPWCHQARRRNSTARRGHSSERNTRDDTGERGFSRDRELTEMHIKTTEKNG